MRTSLDALRSTIGPQFRFLQMRHGVETIQCQAAAGEHEFGKGTIPDAPAHLQRQTVWTIEGQLHHSTDESARGKHGHAPATPWPLQHAMHAALNTRAKRRPGFQAGEEM